MRLFYKRLIWIYFARMSYYRSSTQRHVTIKLYYKHDNFTLNIPKNQVTTTKKRKIDTNIW